MIRLAWRLALRDLRGGTSGLFIVLLCLGVGVAAIAGIGSLRAALNQGITESDRGILGGDIALSTGLGPFPPAVPAWFIQRGAHVSETVDTRSILIAPNGRRILTAARAVGPGWPLIGTVRSDPAGQFASLARGADGKPGLLLAPSAASSLGLHPGDAVSLGWRRAGWSRSACKSCCRRACKPGQSRPNSNMNSPAKFGGCGVRPMRHPISPGLWTRPPCS
jgi:putative ABC transport system permease protein